MFLTFKSLPSHANSVFISDYTRTLTHSEWSCHFASFTPVSPAVPQVQQSRPCSRVTAVLCLVGHWSSPPLQGDSTSLFSYTEVTSHLQASCADWEVLESDCVLLWITCCALKTDYDCCELSFLCICLSHWFPAYHLCGFVLLVVK